MRDRGGGGLVEPDAERAAGLGRRRAVARLAGFSFLLRGATWSYGLTVGSTSLRRGAAIRTPQLKRFTVFVFKMPRGEPGFASAGFVLGVSPAGGLPWSRVRIIKVVRACGLRP